MIWTQTGALFLDAYRELNAKKMFWVVLGLTVLVLAAFGCLGVNSGGFSVLWYTVPGTGPIGSFIYKTVFSYVVVGLWFTWLAALLALISTAGIFPDFLSAGSVDLYLSRPISRWRLFVTKYAAGLLFVLLQVTIFAVVSFFLLGIRAGLWQPGLFVAIPVIVLFFSYLYAICVLLGVLTRSTVAALMLTLLAWFGIWAVDRVDVVLVRQINSMNSMHEDLGERIEILNRRIAATQAAGTQGAGTQEAGTVGAGTLGTGSAPATSEARVEEGPPDVFVGPMGMGARLPRRGDLVGTRDLLVQERDMYEVPPAIYTVDRVVVIIKTFLPKTRETTAILDRVLFTDKDLQEASRHEEPAPEEAEDAMAARRRQRQEQRMASWIDPTRDRSVWWVVGTSLAFEVVVMGVAGWLFVRRDY